ncbi:MAG: YybH family protein [Cyanobium sp.]|jgi:uncharacterized protein (TIGR02246 family)
MSEPNRAIRELFEHRYPAAVAGRDRLAYLALYTDDALWIHPGDVPRRGPDAIAAGFEAMLAGYAIQPRFVAEEIERHGPSATVLGQADALVTNLGDGSQQKQTFHALWIVRAESDQHHHLHWRIHRQIWTPTRSAP